MSKIISISYFLPFQFLYSNIVCYLEKSIYKNMPLILGKECNMKAAHTKQTKERYWKRNICYWWALFLSSYTKNLSVIVTLHNYKPARLNDIRYFIHTSHYHICNMNVKCDMLMYRAQTALAQYGVSLIDCLITIKPRLIAMKIHFMIRWTQILNNIITLDTINHLI